MKIVFFGTPNFSVPFLKALIQDSNIDVVGVVCQPDKPSGRGGAITMPAVKICASTHDVPVFQPSSLKKDPSIQEDLAAYNADFFVVVAYGKLIPASILSTPKYGCINVHPSLLPRHRGPSPLQWAIAEGDATTGVTIMLLDEGMDTGPLLASEHITLDAEETYESLVQKVHQSGPQLLVETLKRFYAGEIIPVDQDEKHATLTRLLSKEDGHVNWSKRMSQIEREHRGYHAWPGTWAVWERQNKPMRLKFQKLRASDFKSDMPRGMVTIKNDRMYIDCQDGTLEILTIQPEGKSIMSVNDFIKGYPDIDGALLN